jgi:hypothetical protein
MNLFVAMDNKQKFAPPGANNSFKPKPLRGLV